MGTSSKGKMEVRLVKMTQTLKGGKTKIGVLKYVKFRAGKPVK